MKSLLSFLLPFFLFLSFCASSAAEDYTGDYDLQPEGCSGSLSVKPSGKTHLSISIETVCGPNAHICTYEGTCAPVGRSAVLSRPDDPECRLRIFFRGESAEIEQEGICDCGVGATMAGRYLKKKSKSLRPSGISQTPAPASDRVSSGIPPKQRIISASGVRVRNEPRTNAKEIARLQIGTVVDEKESLLQRNAQGEDNWYRVELQDGTQGWVYGKLTRSFDPGKRAQTYSEILRTQLKAEKINFADQVDLFRFLARAVDEVKEPQGVAELKLGKWLALKRSLEAIPFNRMDQSPYYEWLREQADSIVYNEPAGQWLVRSDLFWELRDQYKSFPIAEQIAWEGANIPLPGECEGYLPCYLNMLNWTEGRYLNLYPNGVHVDEVLNHWEEYFRSLVENKDSLPPPSDKTEREEIREEINKLRDTLTKISDPEKKVILEQLDRIGRFGK